MSYFGIANITVTLILAMFVMASTVCRITQVDMRSIRARYAAPLLLLFMWSASVFFSLIGGDTPDWYQPLALAAMAVYLWNNRDDWKGGVPDYMLRATYMRENLNGNVLVGKRMNFENSVVVVLTVFTMGAAAVGAMDGRGDPLQIYSAQAEPPVATPGGTIKIVYSFRRVRVCAGYVDRFIVRRTGEVAQHFDTSPIGQSDIGKKMDNIGVTLKLIDLAPGPYIYRAVIYHSCPDANYTARSPDVPFIVSPAPVKQ